MHFGDVACSIYTLWGKKLHHFISEITLSERFTVKLLLLVRIIYSTKFFETKRHQNRQSLLKHSFKCFVKRCMSARVRYQSHVSLNVFIIVANIYMQY